MENDPLLTPPLRYGIFHMFHRYFFLKASLSNTQITAFWHVEPCHMVSKMEIDLDLNEIIFCFNLKA